MELANLNIDNLNEAVKNAHITHSGAIMVILTDGVSLCGLLPAHYQKFSKKLTLEDRRKKTKRYYIPVEKIAGIYSLAYSQKAYYADTVNEEILERNSTSVRISLKYITKDELIATLKNEEKYYTYYSFENSFLDDLNTKCCVYQIECHEHDSHSTYGQVAEIGTHQFITKTPFVWGELKTNYSIPIYADWEYISQLAGGINSIGIGILAVSLSAGYEKSLSKVRDTLLNKAVQSLDDIDHNKMSPVVIQSYVNTIQIQKSGNKKGTQYEVIEGEKWFYVILSENKISNAEDLKKGQWCAGLMREACLLVPQTVFESMQSPCLIQGDVIPIPLSTSFGDSNIVIKIRNISSIASEE